MPLLFPDGFLSLNGDMNIETDKFGNKYWFLNGELHREGGPAIDGISGSKEWFLNGKRHREDGPAVERDDGSKEWCLNGKRHREDGPAVEFPDGTKHYYLGGVKLRVKTLDGLKRKLKEFIIQEVHES